MLLIVPLSDRERESERERERERARPRDRQRQRERERERQRKVICVGDSRYQTAGSVVRRDSVAWDVNAPQ